LDGTPNGAYLEIATNLLISRGNFASVGKKSLHKATNDRMNTGVKATCFGYFVEQE
jgi:hypothetical protein